MNLPAALGAIRWLVFDTFRQAWASGVALLMLGVTALAVLLCLSVSFNAPEPLPKGPTDRQEVLPKGDPETKDPSKLERSGVEVPSGEMRIMFGAIRIPLERPKDVTLRWFQFLLVGFAADTLGVLLALVWTAGFLPTFLEPGSVSVLLAKPVPRWSLLAGKFLGVFVFLVAQAVLFVGGTWLALGLVTGFFPAVYLVAVPMLCLHFLVFYSFSALLAVYTRSTVVCVVGSIVFWGLCWGMNWGRHELVHMTHTETVRSAPVEPKGKEPVKPSVERQDVAAGFSPVTRFLTEAGYWVMPKPTDLGIILFDAMGAGDYYPKQAAFVTVQKEKQFQPELSVLASLLASLVILGLAGYQFVTTDY